ncbi:copper chaperone PCu(A)C [Sphingorhabdus sp. SMR4y]|uniref:copper chaperone PCu(A)C n=1 Tax=Sphingorhabdus sp. SMR4y TaxID=2584094 RepID=UPI000B5C380F|nr:copper chaperone PCu(A)C [Sphingorhabdus sp. SMR4y]ASK86965.1 copper chaperone PCu(A)C [Sphingorhabdus sp. SMR4y]
MNKLSFMIAASASLMLASCGQGDILYADNAVVNLSPVDGNPSSGYMDLHGGRVDVELVSVTSDDVLRLEMHETTEEDGMMSMAKLKSIPVPAGETVKLEPGGKHLMIWGVGAGSKKRGLLTMTLIYSNNDRIEIDAAIRKVGDPVPGTEE